MNHYFRRGIDILSLNLFGGFYVDTVRVADSLFGFVTKPFFGVFFGLFHVDGVREEKFTERKYHHGLPKCDRGGLEDCRDRRVPQPLNDVSNEREDSAHRRQPQRDRDDREQNFSPSSLFTLMDPTLEGTQFGSPIVKPNVIGKRPGIAGATLIRCPRSKALAISPQSKNGT